VGVAENQAEDIDTSCVFLADPVSVGWAPK
jgi:hypothetical protein